MHPPFKNLTAQQLGQQTLLCEKRGRFEKMNLCARKEQEGIRECRKGTMPGTGGAVIDEKVRDVEWLFTRLLKARLGPTKRTQASLMEEGAAAEVPAAA
jgi:hypothetical protein